MSPTAVLVVLILSSAESDPAAPALEAAARELLGETATIRVMATPTDLSDAATLQRAGTADGVVELAWNDDQQSALLHCYVARDGRWVDRKISFGAGDEAPQRGRLLGFAIASMFPRLAAPAATEPPRDERPISPDSKASVAAERRATPPRFELELGATATTGVQGPGDALGAVVGVRVPLGPALSLHASVGARRGEIPSAQATTQSATGALGLAWLASPADGSVQLGLRADLIASWMVVTRPLASSAEPESRARWMSGGAALVEGGYRFIGRLGAYGGAGAEILLTPTDVYAEGRLTAKLPTFRVVGELGLRARF
ncbi:MAG: hypothetical protein ABUL60_16755 [Myxococcales bacterium]